MADLGPGDMIPMSLMEMGVRERARVISIDPCPPIEEGPGHVVTAVLSSDGIDMKRLKLAGLAEPIEVTGNHPIFSEDRRDFVTVTHLRDGERLRTRDGTIAVESVTAMPGLHRVYNMEVGDAHQYYVSERLVLVHNDNSNNDKPRKPTKPGVSGKEGAKNAPSWARGERPYVGENGKQFAERLMKDKYGPNWREQGTGPGSEYNQIKKWGDRSF